LINKELQRLPDWKRAGKRENSEFHAFFPKVIHKFFHRKGDRQGEIFLCLGGRLSERAGGGIQGNTKAPLDGAFVSVPSELPLCYF
jgi:hypothetical protein